MSEIAPKEPLEAEIDEQVYDLYDEYCHGEMERREFLRRASALAVAGGSGLAMAQALLPRFAAAHTISFTDERIKATYVDYDSKGGTSGRMRAYLVRPNGEGPFPAVIVIHENRGLNPYIEDVARRAAVEGFLALAPDGLSPAGGYPGNDDDGKALQRSLDQSKLEQDMLNSAEFVRTHADSTGRLGAVGFCWGGGVTNFLAVTMGENLHAAVPFYGSAPASDQVTNIRAPLLIQSAENDPRINAMWPEFEEALKTNGVNYERYLYPGTRHGFHNDSTPRYDEAAANLAWDRTIALYKRHLV
jgi:carboxymethylenebutenolidase